MLQYQGGKDRCIWDEVGRTGVSGIRWEGSFRLDTWAPSQNAILQFKAPQRPVRLVCADARDAHFVVADESKLTTSGYQVLCVTPTQFFCSFPWLL